MKKVRWGVLGTANIAKTQTIPGMVQAENCQLYAVAGRTAEKTRQFQQEFSFEKCYTSYGELLDDENVDAVYIPLPNSMHKEWIMKAAKKGKHILCEKPLAVTAEDAREIVKACNEAGVILMEAYAYLHSDITKAMIEDINAGVIGKPIMLEAVFFTGRPAEGDIRLKRETYGGAAYDLGCYNVSLALRVFGRKPEIVNAMGHFTNQHIDDYSSIYMNFGDGQTATTAAAMNEGQFDRGDRYFIYGTEGTLEANINYNQPGTCAYRIVTAEGTKVVEKEVKSNYCLEVEQMGRCILENEKPFVSNDFTIAVAETMDMALEKMQY